MVRVEILFLLMRLPSANLVSFFSNGDIPNIKAAPLNNLGMARVNALEKSDLEAVKIGQILDRMMIAWTIAVIS